MPVMKVSNAQLYYEVQGEGALLLLIAGANGTGEIFQNTMPYLASHFSVITYDRRGFSRSVITGEQDYSQRLERDADDAAKLIEHVRLVKEQPLAFVFGTSSGAIVASALLRRHSNIISKLICHEPPLYKALSENDGREVAMAGTRQIYEIYRAKGAIAALQPFIEHNFTPAEREQHRKRSNSAINPYASGNQIYWFEREVLVYPFKDIPWDEFEKEDVKKRLIMGVSEQGGQFPAARVAKAIGEKLDLNPSTVSFPGGHLGYTTDPESFAVAVRKALNV